ncbi:hypothetical protein BDV59DRAFT_199305 [Aspergillus ambiguus]|uniref:uncharacterized protein n=1 Tax=Aspergillus ambiguus TaxID=176160 RepID=UPI003CCCD48C
MPLHARMHVHTTYEPACRPLSPVTSTMDEESAYHRPSMPYSTEPDHYFGGRSSRDVRVNKIYTQTYMYICCQCQDGPKVYNVQPQCVSCNHVVCSNCTYVK